MSNRIVSQPNATPNTDQEITSLNAQIQSLEMREREARNLLHFIVEMRRELETRRDVLQASKNIMNVLPTELLIHIFEAFVLGAAEAEDDNFLSSFHSPVVISHVCKKWRAVALSVSSLWSRVLLHKSHVVKAYLLRSGDAPLDLVCCSTHPKEISFGYILSASVDRWRSVTLNPKHHGSMSTLLSLLHRTHVFERLESLNLTLDRPLVGLPSIPGIIQSRDKFAVLERIHLSQVLPLHLPAVALPKVRYIHISFQGNTFYMSGMCPFLTRAPALEELILNDAVPILDVYLTKVDAKNTDATSQTADRKVLLINVVDLPKLRRLDWGLAPPKDLWRLFIYLNTPCLEELYLVLDKCTVRWMQYYDSLSIPLDSAQPVRGAHPSIADVIHLPNLKTLVVDSPDSDALSCALKKLHLANLEHLSIIHIPVHRMAAQPILPRHESIFRDPRLPMLTHLTLSHFKLDTVHVLTMLQYMQALTNLTLEACDGMGRVICLLSGDCKHAREWRSEIAEVCAGTQRWLCPHLDHIVLRDSDDVDFVCLAAMVRARRLSAMTEDSVVSGISRSAVGNTEEAPVATKRTVRPLPKQPKSRREAVGQHEVVVDANARAPTPRGSPIPGWNSHEVLRAVRIVSVRVEGYSSITQAQISTLKREPYGVTEVIWEA